ncbi:hypothetical protein [Thalassobaculum sp.]|uniref:hypothetical protein n=1 Tax=Thalassobaculum sp. TaxID=2022740 RepID=UPI0032EE4A49
MSDFRNQNRTFLAKIESTPGTDAAPVVGTDAIRVEAPTHSDNWELIEVNEVTGGLDRSPRQTGGGSASQRVTTILKGSGTGGAAPEVGPLLRMAALSQTLIAADVTDVLQASSTTTALKLASGDVSADGDYIGAIIRLTSGAYSGYTGVITGSTASTDTVEVFPAVAGAAALGDGYTIDAAAVYQPASSSLELGSCYLWNHPSAAGLDAILEKVVGAAANGQLTVPVRGVGRWQFDISGKLVAPSETTDPGVGTYDGLAGVVLVAATAYLGTEAIKFNEFSLNLGNEVSLADDPSEAYGFDKAGVVRRRITCRINPRRVNLATRNTFSRISAGTTVPLWLKWGTGDGGVLSIYAPAARAVSREDVDNNGFAHEGVDFDLGGVDSAAYFCFA